MFKFIKNKRILISLILLIIFAINTNFFKNVTQIIQYKFHDRMITKYPFCGDESVGYLIYLKKKYKINDNPKIINYIHTPPVNWSIVNTKKLVKNSKKLILLNYPGLEFEIKLEKINNNLFVFKDIDFYATKFDKIESVMLIDDINDLKKIDTKININVVDKLKNKKNIKNLNIDSKIKLNIAFNNLIIDEKKLYLEIDDKNLYDFKNLQIKILLKNKYNLKNFKIIDESEITDGNRNCYYVEKI
jgi:hypothetical protein